MLQQIDINPTAKALAWIPQATEKIPAYVYFTGVSEAGYMDKMDNQGPFAFLREGSIWKPRFYLFSICMLTTPKAFPAPATVDGIINSLVAKYPMIDTTRIYGLGFSAGAEAIGLYCMALPEYAQRFAAITLYGTTYKVLNAYLTSATKAANLDLVPTWLLHNELDTDANHPLALAKKVYAAMKAKGRTNVALTIPPGLGHGNVNGRYDPNYQSPYAKISQYTWCQKYNRPAAVPDTDTPEEEPGVPVPAPTAPTIRSIVTITTWSDGKVDIKQDFK